MTDTGPRGTFPHHPQISGGPPSPPGDPQGQGDPHGQGDPQGQGGAQHSALPPGRNDSDTGGAEPPAPVRIAYELWCAVAALGVATTVGLLLVMSGMQDDFVDEFRDRFADGIGGQSVTRADVVSSFHISLGILGVLGAVVIGLVWFFARRMLRGRGWARATLVGITAVVTVLGFEGLMGFDGDGAGPPILEIATILQAVTAIGASVIAHRGEANRYFVRGRPR